MKWKLVISNCQEMLRAFVKDLGGEYSLSRQILRCEDCEYYLRIVQNVEDAHKLAGMTFSAVLYYYRAPVMVPGEIMNFLSSLVREPANAPL